MSEQRTYELKWVGWNTKDGSDKIWGYITLNNQYYNFWCKRGSKPKFKHHADRHALMAVWDKKVRDNYVEQTDMSIIWPTFIDDLESAYIIAKFSGTIMTDAE